MTTYYVGPAPQPVLGPRAKRALELTAEWRKPDRALFVLLSAFHDAGVSNPFAVDLARRLKIDVATLDEQLARLAARGVLWTVRRPKTRNHYVLRLLGDTVPEHDAKRFEAFERQRLARNKAKTKRTPKREPVAA